MTIRYFMFEAVPHASNPEVHLYKGGFINCWVRATDESAALHEAITYLRETEGWEVTNIEERSIATREQYEGDSEKEESFECFDLAVNNGIGVILYTWNDDDDAG